MVDLKNRIYLDLTKLAFLKLLQNLPEIYKTENVEKAFSFLTSLIKNSIFGVRMARMRGEWISI